MNNPQTNVVPDYLNQMRKEISAAILSVDDMDSANEKVERLCNVVSTMQRVAPAWICFGWGFVGAVLTIGIRTRIEQLAECPPLLQKAYNEVADQFMPYAH